MKLLEALCIRLLHILRALSPRRRPGLCPPKCSQMHTYRFPCRARTQVAFYERVIGKKVNHKPEYVCNPKFDVGLMEQRYGKKEQ